ncbi:hypothetical protein LCL97_00455 [Seohaeicola saemankumensis]|nr:hypothetical protein [Seohaeicola saemankumensis]MCA0869283.1 hypothetical protein [Seohaeicola saemankumensis]
MGNMDEIGRRKRFHRMPTGARVQITERILAVLEALHWYGNLPTNYLYEFTRDLPKSRDRVGFVKLLAKLFHENAYVIDGEYITLPNGAGLLDRPARQKKAAENPLGVEMIHALSEQGCELLRSLGRIVPNAFSPSGPFEHRLFGSCAMASIDLGTRVDPDLEFIPQHRIIDTSQPSYVVAGQRVKNDGICAIRRTSTGRTFYLFHEYDRDTERTHMSRSKAKSWERTVLQARAFLAGGQFRRYVGAQDGDVGLLLNLTVGHRHLSEMLKVIEKHFPSGCPFILSQSYPHFGAALSTPPVLPLLTEPWVRAGRSDYRFL